MHLAGNARRRAARATVVAATSAVLGLAAAPPAHAKGCGLLGLFPCPKPAAGTGSSGSSGGSEAPSSGGTTYKRCGLLGLFMCPVPAPSGPPAPPPDPSVPLGTGGNPFNLKPLPKRTDPAAPLYTRDDGHVRTGLTDGGAGEDTAGAERGAAVVRGMGGKFVRVLLHWPVVQPQSTKFVWSRPDAVYKAYIKKGIRPVFQIHGTPKWAVGLLERFRCDGNYCYAEPEQYRAAQLVRTLAFELARRYPLLGAIEYRNEPSIGNGPRPAIPAARYAIGLNAVWQGVRSVDSGIPVWGGAMATTPGWGDYLRTVLTNAQVDAVSVHPYDWSPDFHHLEQHFQVLDQVLAAVGRPTMRVVVSEVGAAMSAGHHGSVTFPDVSTERETSFERNWRYFQALSPGMDGPKPAAASASRVDALLYHTAVPDPQGGGDFGWTAYRAVGTKLPPRQKWCLWRTVVAGMSRFAGDDHIAACPTESQLRARARARRR